MDEKQLAGIIQQRLGLEDQEFSLIRENPKFQHLFENAAKGARKRKEGYFIQHIKNTAAASEDSEYLRKKSA